jgi:SET domain
MSRFKSVAAPRNDGSKAVRDYDLGEPICLIDDMRHLSWRHSCDANAAVRGERELFALRPIASGEEITIDHAMTARPAFYMRLHRIGVCPAIVAHQIAGG